MSQKDPISPKFNGVNVFDQPGYIAGDHTPLSKLPFEDEVTSIPVIYPRGSSTLVSPWKPGTFITIVEIHIIVQNKRLLHRNRCP